MNIIVSCLEIVNVAGYNIDHRAFPQNVRHRNRRVSFPSAEAAHAMNRRPRLWPEQDGGRA